MLNSFALCALLAIATPVLQEEETAPETYNPLPQIEQEHQEEDDEVADRSSKNSNEYNLYDREQNRSRGSQNQQYYYYQNPGDNGNTSRKLYQRDNG